MKLFFDFFPIILFFISFKLSNLYTATAIAISASIIQVLIYRIKYKRFETLQLISLLIILVLGGATLLFHNPWFIKWKPTGLYWLSALVFLGSSLFTYKPVIQRMMEGNIQVPAPIWIRLNYAWVLFFLAMGALNLYVAYYYSTDTWVNFKLFGGAFCTIVFVVVQALYLSRHLIEKDVVCLPKKVP